MLLWTGIVSHVKTTVLGFAGNRNAGAHMVESKWANMGGKIPRRDTRNGFGKLSSVPSFQSSR